MQTLKIINDNIRKISETNTLLDMLLEFEGVLDTFDIYAYKNWKKGEVVKGPKLGRYFIEVSLMYPYQDMPDPEALLRLKSNDCDVKMYKDQLIKSKKILKHEIIDVSKPEQIPNRETSLERTIDDTHPIQGKSEIEHDSEQIVLDALIEQLDST